MENMESERGGRAAQHQIDRLERLECVLLQGAGEVLAVDRGLLEDDRARLDHRPDREAEQRHGERNRATENSA